MNENNQITTTKVSARERKLKGEKRMEMITKMTGMTDGVMGTATTDAGHINVGKAQMSLRNPQHKRDAHYEAIGGVWAGLENLRVLDLCKEDSVPQNCLIWPIPAKSLMNLMSAIAEGDFSAWIPDQAVEEYICVNGGRLPGVIVDNDGKIVDNDETITRASLRIQRDYVRSVMAPIAAAGIMETAEWLLSGNNLTKEQRKCCRKLSNAIKMRYYGRLIDGADFLRKVESASHTLEMPGELRLDVLGEMFCAQKSDGKAPKMNYETLLSFNTIMKALGPNAAGRLEDVVSDTEIDGLELSGLYFQNDGETVSFVDDPSRHEKLQYIHYVLAPLGAKILMESLAAIPQSVKDEMSSEDREEYRELMWTLKRNFSEYLNPATGYIDNLKAWKKRGGKISKCLIMKIK